MARNPTGAEDTVADMQKRRENTKVERSRARLILRDRPLAASSAVCVCLCSLRFPFFFTIIFLDASSVRGRGREVVRGLSFFYI